MSIKLLFYIPSLDIMALLHKDIMTMWHYDIIQSPKWHLTGLHVAIPNASITGKDRPSPDNCYYKFWLSFKIIKAEKCELNNQKKYISNVYRNILGGYTFIWSIYPGIELIKTYKKDLHLLCKIILYTFSHGLIFFQECL